MQFIVFREWWTALFIRYARPLKPLRPLTDSFWRNAYLLAAAVNFIAALAILSGFPVW